MTQISFFNAVNFGNQPKTTRQSLLETVDDYFYLGGKKACVIPGKIQNNSIEVEFRQDSPNFLTTIIKVITYCTLVFPLFMLIAKAALRSKYEFHVTSRSQEEQPINAQPTQNNTTQAQDSTKKEHRFSYLMNAYFSTIRTTEGTGERGQLYVDNAYRDLEEYAKKHPEARLPVKHKVSKDGTFGASGFGSAFMYL